MVALSVTTIQNELRQVFDLADSELVNDSKECFCGRYKSFNMLRSTLNTIHLKV